MTEPPLLPTVAPAMEAGFVSSQRVLPRLLVAPQTQLPGPEATRPPGVQGSVSPRPPARGWEVVARCGLGLVSLTAHHGQSLLCPPAVPPSTLAVCRLIVDLQELLSWMLAPLWPHSPRRLLFGGLSLGFLGLSPETRGFV